MVARDSGAHKASTPCPRYSRDMLFDAFSGWVAKWWWLITLVVVVVILLIPGKRSHRKKKKGHSSGTGPEQRRVGSRSSGAQLRPAHRVETPTFPAHRVDSHTIRARRVESPTRTITGKAYVTDGDGIRVARTEVRLAGLDAPEWDQKAKHQDGYWFNHGKREERAHSENWRQACQCGGRERG